MFDISIQRHSQPTNACVLMYSCGKVIISIKYICRRGFTYKPTKCILVYAICVLMRSFIPSHNCPLMNMICHKILTSTYKCSKKKTFFFNVDIFNRANPYCLTFARIKTLYFFCLSIIHTGRSCILFTVSLNIWVIPVYDIIFTLYMHSLWSRWWNYIFINYLSS